MQETANLEAETVLDRFVETMFKLMMEHHQKHVLELDLTVPQAQALRVLRRGPLCTGELATELRISAPAVTQLTNRLTRKHLIERRAVDKDRRSVLVALTDRGKQAVDMFRERRNTIFGDALACLDDDTRSNIVLGLSKMVSVLEKLDAESARIKVASVSLEAVVHEEYETAPVLDDSDSQTAVQSLMASNTDSRMKVGPTGRRMKMEWD
jgi:MarR family transcriptional regulator, organic hydroperoxide resistance regulator